MKKITVFYDDEKKSCRSYANEMERYENVVCKKASDYQSEKIIFEDGRTVLFLFESERGKPSRNMEHLMKHLVISKQESHAIVVTGGSREFNALRIAHTILKERGFIVKNIYTQYVFEKNGYNEISAVRKMIKDLEDGDENFLLREEQEDLTRQEIRSHLRSELKKYKLYRKKRRHRSQ